MSDGSMMAACRKAFDNSSVAKEGRADQEAFCIFAIGWCEGARYYGARMMPIFNEIGKALK